YAKSRETSADLPISNGMPCPRTRPWSRRTADVLSVAPRQSPIFALCSGGNGASRHFGRHFYLFARRPARPLQYGSGALVQITHQIRRAPCNNRRGFGNLLSSTKALVRSDGFDRALRGRWFSNIAVGPLAGVAQDYRRTSFFGRWL